MSWRDTKNRKVVVDTKKQVLVDAPHKVPVDVPHTRYYSYEKGVLGEISSEKMAVAAQINTKYFIRASGKKGFERTLYNPLTEKSFGGFIHVSKSGFESYLKYLETRGTIHFRNASRNILEK